MACLRGGGTPSSGLRRDGLGCLNKDGESEVEDFEEDGIKDNGAGDAGDAGDRSSLASTF